MSFSTTEVSMKPLPVYAHEHAKHVLVGWACPTCKRVTLERNLDPAMGANSWSWVTARDHCNIKCRQCGMRVEKGRKLCFKCASDEALHREEERFDRSRKLTPGQWMGPVFAQDSGEFFPSVGALVKFCADNDLPLYRASCCHRRDLTIKVEEYVQDTFSNSAAEQTAVRLKELQEVIDTWIEKHGVAWFVPSDEESVVFRVDCRVCHKAVGPFDYQYSKDFATCSDCIAKEGSDDRRRAGAGSPQADSRGDSQDSVEGSSRGDLAGVDGSSRSGG